MAQRKPYNPNTKYGRRKLREQAQKTYESLSPEEKADWDLTKFIFILVIMGIAFLIFYLSGNPNGFLKWISK